ncbi:phage tail protein [Ruminiclostridium hungatei]|uniref:Phage tail protein n=1 Tax=Ruminiclostridium hungatei TaxID=48256 RepID=A0A1V4SRA5_RUMHU|nr:distal tail protein Dit [Ruminiclostridium hungatei]OPX46384.1 phage tail protein [Ruminiclostridium hungatei]
MANYNSGRIYNRRIANGGASYNSAPFVIIVLDSGYGIDEVKNIISAVNVTDDALGADSIVLIANIEFKEQSTSVGELVSITSTVSVSDEANGDDTISPIKAMVEVNETANGVDNANVAGAFFVIDSNDIFQPLGVMVLRDSRFELIPSTRDSTDEIPGMHGEFDFGSEFNSRAFDLHVATDEGYSPLEKAQLQRLFAKYLDPTKGAKTLIFSDDIEKTYVVKYSGKIDPTQYPTWFEFTIPFKMSNPFIMGSFENALTGSGILVNRGTFETPITIEIAGPVINPSLTIGGQTISYTGTVPSGQTLVIISKGSSGTAKLAGANAMSGYNGAFPSLPPGETNVTAGENVTIRWKDRWL